VNTYGEAGRLVGFVQQILASLTPDEAAGITGAQGERTGRSSSPPSHHCADAAEILNAKGADGSNPVTEAIVTEWPRH
jgi:hypothetical protein